MPRGETTQLINAYLAAFNAGDVGSLLDLLDDDVVHDINQGDREIGREKFRWFLGQLHLHYRETLADIVIMVSDDGNRAAAEFTIHGTYLATSEGLPVANGQTYSLSAGIFFEIDDGRISRVSTYYNLAEWIRQIGTKERS